MFLKNGSRKKPIKQALRNLEVGEEMERYNNLKEVLDFSDLVSKEG